MKLSNLVGQALDGKYLIEKQLGKGGMGAVFLATHLGTERPVAVKVIMPQYMQHDEFVERFRREARAAGRLRHPNVVDVTDFGFADVDHDRVAYLVMEYLDGCTLDEVLEEEGKLPLTFTLEILEQVCSAVEDAHQQGIIHRDLKPDNIWLEPNRRGGYTVKVLDFGIAKLEEATIGDSTSINKFLDSQHRNKSLTMSAARGGVGGDETGTLIFPPKDSTVSAYKSKETAEGATQIQSPSIITKADEQFTEAETRQMKPLVIEEDGTQLFDLRGTEDKQNQQTSSISSLTRAGSVLGTPLYMSPEQCKGKTLDQRSDVYSLGIIAYQMLSGTTPFSGEYKKVMEAHINKEPPMLKVKGVRKKVLNVVMTSLAKNPDERPSSAAAFASILRANSEGVGILFQRALTLYSSRLPTFLKLGVIGFLPLIVITLLQVGNSILWQRGILPEIIGRNLSYVLGLLSFLIGLLNASVVMAIIAWIVTSINAAPLKPIQIRSAWIALKARIRPFLWTTTPINLLTMIGIIFLIIPGLVVMANYALVPVVTLLEGLTGRAAWRRSRELAKRSRRTVVATVIIQFFAPVILTALSVFIITTVSRGLDSRKSPPNKTEVIHNKDAKDDSDVSIQIQTSQTHPAIVKINGDAKKIAEKKEESGGNIFRLIWLPVQIILTIFGGIVTSLLYIKTRHAGGESTKDILDHFEYDRPRAKWQQKMRERVSVQTRTSKS